MHVYLQCAGAARRWQPPRPLPKQLLEVHGETLLARLARQAREHGCDPVVVGPPTFDLPGVPRLKAPGNKTACGVGKVDCVRGWWPDGEPVLVLFGDVYLTDPAADLVFPFRAHRLHWIGRKGPSRIKRWGERFGVFVPPDARPDLFGMCDRIRAAFRGCAVAKAAASTIERNLRRENSKHNHFLSVPHRIHDDHSDDFDLWEEWQRWCALYYPPGLE